MKKYLLTLSVLALFAIGFAASTSDDTEAIAPEEIPASCEEITVAQIKNAFDNNAMRAKSMYEDKWFEIEGYVDDIQDDYLCLAEKGEGYSRFMYCYYKTENVRKQVMNLNQGDRITVKGQVYCDIADQPQLKMVEILGK